MKIRVAKKRAPGDNCDADIVDLNHGQTWDLDKDGNPWFGPS